MSQELNLDAGSKFWGAQASSPAVSLNSSRDEIISNRMQSEQIIHQSGLSRKESPTDVTSQQEFWRQKKSATVSEGMMQYPPTTPESFWQQEAKKKAESSIITEVDETDRENPRIITSNYNPLEGILKETPQMYKQPRKAVNQKVATQGKRGNSVKKLNNLTDKEKTEAYFDIYDKNLALQKHHTKLEEDLKKANTQLARLKDSVKHERILAETYTGQDFKSSFIEGESDHQKMFKELTILRNRNKELENAATNGKLLQQLGSREGPLLKKHGYRPKVLTEGITYDVSKKNAYAIMIKKTTNVNYDQRSQKSVSPVRENDFNYEELMKELEITRSSLRIEKERVFQLESQIRFYEISGNNSDMSQRNAELLAENKRLELQLRDMLKSPFAKNQEIDPKLLVMENELNIRTSSIQDYQQRITKLEANIIHITQDIKAVSADRDRFKEECLKMSVRLEEKNRYLDEFENQLRSLGGNDTDAFMKALGLMKLKGEEPAWSRLDFIERSSNVPDDLVSLKREIERLKLEKGQLAAELEKIQSLLVLKNEMEKEKNALNQSENEQMKMQLKSAQQRAEELARLADFRSNRVIQLERNQRLNVYDDANRIVASKNVLSISEFDRAAPEFEDAGTEVSTGENIVDLWLGAGEFYQFALEQTLKENMPYERSFVSFLTVDFFNHETQSTSLCEGLTPRYQIHISFKVAVDEFFIKTLEKEYIYLEAHINKSDSHVTFARAKIPLIELLERAGPMSDINMRPGVIESASTFVSAFDGRTSVGVQTFKLRMRYPLSEAVRWFKEKQEIVELSNPKQFALETVYAAEPSLKERSLIVTVFRCIGLSGTVYPGNLRPFVFYQFFTDPETLTKSGVGPDPVFDETNIFNIKQGAELKRYLDNQTLEFIVFDDNAPIREGGQDIIGTAHIPLTALLLDTAIEGTYQLFNLRGQEAGGISLRVAWRDSKADQIGYGSPLTEA